MEDGFGSNLEGFLIKSNLSILPATLPNIQGDGSLEVAGSFYTNTIQEYTINNGVNIEDVLFKNYQITIPYTAPSVNLTSASFILDGGISIKNTTNSSSLTNGGTITSLGGASFGKNVIIGGTLDVNDNRILNVDWPILGSDGVNKDYVDSLTFGSLLTGNFTTGQVLFGGTSAGSVVGYNTFLYDNYKLILNAPIFISDTTNYINATTASLVLLGGASIGGNLSLNNNNIINLATPINDYDAATKEYVDNNSGVNGNFTAGQLIIAYSTGSTVRGFDNLTFETVDNTNGTLNINNNTNIFIENTSVATNLSSGGTITSLGGASFMKNVLIGNGLDVNMKNITSVADPIDDYDAVNKKYVDDLFDEPIDNGVYYKIENNIVIATDVPNFIIDSNVKAFTAFVYTHYDNQDCAIFTLNCYQGNAEWLITKTFVGGPTNIDFFIRRDILTGNGIIQYTNTNINGFSSIRYRIITEIEDIISVENTTQNNYILNNNINTFTELNTPLSFDNITYDALKLIVYVSNTTTNKYSIFFINCLLKGSIWVSSISTIGNAYGIVSFNVNDNISNCSLQYKNTGISGQTDIKIQQIKVLKTQTSLILEQNTYVPTNIDSNIFNFQLSQLTFYIVIYVENTIDNKYDFYEIEGIVCNNDWMINTRYFGDLSHITFYMNTINDIGYLQYTNNLSNDYIIKYLLTIPTTFNPLDVIKGGTGNNYLYTHAVLRGNGIDPIVGTEDFIYKNNILELGNSSSIYINNTNIALNLSSGGTITSKGGASFMKNVFIGDGLDVGMKNITNVADPIDDYDAVNKNYIDINLNHVFTDEEFVTLDNNVSLQTDVPGFIIDFNIKAFISYVYVHYDNQDHAVFTLKGINKNTLWELSKTFEGFPTNIDFFIRRDSLTGNGIIQYINNNGNGVSSIRFTTLTEIFDTPQDDFQINTTLLTINTYTDIPELEFDNNIYDAVKLVIYIYNTVNNNYGLVCVNAILKNAIWTYVKYSFGNITDISINFSNNINSGILQYKNNGSYNYEIKANILPILKTQNVISLEQNTYIPTQIDSELFIFNTAQYIFQTTIFVYIPTVNNFTLYEIEGVVSDGVWILNTRFIGDISNITFSISTIDYTTGVLKYTNSNNFDAEIKYIITTPTLHQVLPPKKGGSGKGYLYPHAILRGNGLDPIYGSPDLVYKNNIMELGNSSSIFINNTIDAVNLTNGGTITSLGGASLKNLIVGEFIHINNIDITPSIGDILVERVFNANMNQILPDNITGLSFEFINIKSFIGSLCITITTNVNIYDSLFDIKALNKSSGWVIQTSYFGDNTGIIFNITPNGQVQYTSPFVSNWVSTVFKFRGISIT